MNKLTHFLFFIGGLILGIILFTYVNLSLINFDEFNNSYDRGYKDAAKDCVKIIYNGEYMDSTHLKNSFHIDDMNIN